VKRVPHFVFTAGVVLWLATMALVLFIGAWKLWEGWQ
jgi:hypothetical protein